MSKLETNIKHIQRFVNQCINKGVSSYTYSFSVKRELLNEKQATVATENELVKFSDEITILLRQNPILKSLKSYIETSDFLWESSFIENLSALEKKKYAGFNVSSLNTDSYAETPETYDQELPYLSATIQYVLLSRYVDYLKTFTSIENIIDNPEPAEVTAEPEEINVIPVIEPLNLESNFDKRQIEILTKCLNELKIFTIPVTAKMMKDILSCKLKEPLKISKGKNKLLAYFFSSLDNRSLISREWQSVCAKSRLFLSSGKGAIMQQGNFSSAVAQNN
ncbi:MAG: hypothetical protein LIO77_06620 [Rikenellaceae bacterium]|nr:hypothetical protein [Rikenellaceae bacterium]